MASFPKIESPCPYADRLASIMDGEMCRMCHRQVFDLTAMSDGERAAFLGGCEGEVCVSYRRPARVALAAAIAAAALAAPMAAAAADMTYQDVVVGGINDPAHAEWVQDAGDAAIPTLPVSYEPAAAPNAAPQPASTPAPDARPADLPPNQQTAASDVRRPAGS